MAVIYIHFAIFKYINKHLEFLEAIFLRMSKGLLKIHADHIKPVLGNCMMLVLILSNLAIHIIWLHIYMLTTIFVINIYLWYMYIMFSQVVEFDNLYIFLIQS